MNEKEKIEKLHPTELNYFFDSDNFSLESYFIQTLVYLISIDVLKIKASTKKDRILSKKEYVINISSRFFSYESEKYELIFLEKLSEKKQKIELNEYIDLTIGDKISFTNWKSIFKKRDIIDRIELTRNIEKGYLKTTKYLNFIDQIGNDSNIDFQENEKLNIFITIDSNVDFDLIDYIYELTKSYINDKRKDLRKTKWGKINVSPSMPGM